MPLVTSVAKRAAKKAAKPAAPKAAKPKPYKLDPAERAIMGMLGVSAAGIPIEMGYSRAKAEKAKKKSRGPTGTQRFGSKGRR